MRKIFTSFIFLFRSIFSTSTSIIIDTSETSKAFKVLFVDEPGRGGGGVAGRAQNVEVGRMVSNTLCVKFR